MRVTHARPVSGIVHSGRILGRPWRSTCSMVTQTCGVPATRSIAPPTAGFLPGTYQLARSPAAETWRAPSTVTSRCPPRIMAKDIAESVIAAPGMQSDRLLAGVGQVGVALALGGGAQAQHAVLRVQHHLGALGDEVGRRAGCPRRG